MVVPSARLFLAFTENTTIPLHWLWWVLSGRLMFGKSNFTSVCVPYFVIARFTTADDATSFIVLGSTLSGKVSITEILRAVSLPVFSKLIVYSSGVQEIT